MIDEELLLAYFGEPPYYRHIPSGKVTKLPFSVRMSDGSIRTDPLQWAQEPEVMIEAGFEPTEITEQDIENALPKLFEEKERATNQLYINWENYVKYNGFVTSEGWSLGIDVNDVSLLTGAFLLLKEGSSLGLGDTTTIVDMDGVQRTINLQDMTTLMLQYGQFRSLKSQQYSDKLQSIKNATTIQELNNLDLSIGE